jgi:RHS repeat-associated protein
MYGGLHVLYEENTSGTASYIYGPNGKLAKRITINQQGNTYYYHADQIRSTRLVTDTNKNIISAITYHPHGEACVEEGNEGYTFSGKEKDSTGLHYFLGRYYDSNLGTFLSRDPKVGSITQPQTMNRYVYALNNPITIVDPDGHECVNILKGDNKSGNPPDFAKGNVNMKLSTFDIINLLFTVVAALIAMIVLVTIPFAQIGVTITLAVACGKLLAAGIGSVSAILAFVSLIQKLDKEFAEFWECMDEWLEKNDYSLSDVVDAKAIDSDTYLIILEDGTEITVKKTNTGFEIQDDSKVDETSDFPSDPTPPINISPPPTPI